MLDVPTIKDCVIERAPFGALIRIRPYQIDSGHNQVQQAKDPARRIELKIKGLLGDSYTIKFEQGGGERKGLVRQSDFMLVYVGRHSVLGRVFPCTGSLPIQQSTTQIN